MHKYTFMYCTYVYMDTELSWREWYSLHTNSLLFFLCPLQRLEDEAPDGVFTFYRRPNVRYYKVSLQRCMQGEERLILVTTSTMLV